MWIIRLNLLTTREYNLIARTFKKIRFVPKRIPPIIFIKALLFHYLQKKSWRNISSNLNCNYIALFNFYSKYWKSPEIKELFHTFWDRDIIVFIWNSTHFYINDLNNEIFKKITKIEIDKIFE